MKSIFPCSIFTLPGSQLSQEVIFPGKSNFPRSHPSREVIFPGKLYFPGNALSKNSYFPGSYLSREVLFPSKSTFRKLTFPMRCSRPNILLAQKLSQRVIFPEKSSFPRGALSRKFIFTRKSKKLTFPGRYISLEVFFPQYSSCPGTFPGRLIFRTRWRKINQQKKRQKKTKRAVSL